MSAVRDPALLLQLRGYRAWYVVYRPTITDREGFWCVRRWIYENGAGRLFPEVTLFAEGKSLEAVRAKIPANLERHPPKPNDHPCIEEVWR